MTYTTPTQRAQHKNISNKTHKTITYERKTHKTHTDTKQTIRGKKHHTQQNNSTQK